MADASKMTIDYDELVIIVGNYGSGKTEVSINLAVAQKQLAKDVRLVDLDLVNPYFRSREARNQLRDLGVQVILPGEQYMTADLPILSPTVAATIRQQDGLAILDAGGDGLGATVLSTLADALRMRTPRVLQVVNPFRPYTDTVEGCEIIRSDIERCAKLNINGLIGNANLMMETDISHIQQGFEFMQKLSAQNGLPLEFITAPDWLVQSENLHQFTCPILYIKRQLVPPWMQANDLN